MLFQSENPNGGADVAETLSSDEDEDYYEEEEQEEEEDDYYEEEEDDNDDAQNDIQVSFKVLQKLVSLSKYNIACQVVWSSRNIKWIHKI